MSKESKTMEREAQVKARAKEPWTARRVGDLILNNALIIIMVSRSFTSPPSTRTL